MVLDRHFEQNILQLVQRTMKPRDCKRTSQHTFSTNHPTVSFHLDSQSQERIPCGQKIVSFCKVKIDSILRSRLGGRELYSAKENSSKEDLNVGLSERTGYYGKGREELGQFSRKSSTNISSYVPSKAKPVKLKGDVVEVGKRKEGNLVKQKAKRPKCNSIKDKERGNDFMLKTGRQLIMSTVDSKTLRELKKESSRDKLRSITQEQSETLMKAKRISFKKAPKQSKTRAKPNQPSLNVQSFFTTQSLENQESFSLFKESINEAIEERSDEGPESIESIELESDEDEILSLKEIRNFEGTRLVKSSEIKSNNRQRNFNLQESSAIKIQNCWRSYKTREMVHRHLQYQVGKSLVTEEFQTNGEFNLGFLGRRSGITLQRIDMDMLDSESSMSYGEKSAVAKLRQQQGRKWAQIPLLVQDYLSKNNSQADTRSLLQRIATLSSRNRQQLLKLSNIQFHSPTPPSPKSSASSFNTSIDQLSSYNLHKYNKIFQKDNMTKLITYRKSLLDKRYGAEKEMLARKRERGEVDEEGYRRERERMEEWMVEETEEVEITKRYLDIGYKRVKESLAKINVDCMQMARFKGVTLRHGFKSSDCLLRRNGVERNRVRGIDDSRERRGHREQPREDQEEESDLNDWEKDSQTVEMKKVLQNLQFQQSERSLASNSSSKKVLKRSSNMSLHQQTQHLYPSSDSSNDSIDIDELASISLQLQIKNWMDKFRNKPQVKQRIVEQIIQSEIQDLIRQVSHKDLEKYFSQEEGEEKETGIQTDVETVRYFVEVMREHLVENKLMEEYVRSTTRRDGDKRGFFDEVFGAVWEKIHVELEFPEEEEVEKGELKEITEYHYRSAFDSLNESISRVINEQTRPNISLTQYQNIFAASSSQLISDSNFRCGLHKRQLLISQDDLQYIRSQKMDQMTTLQTLATKHWILPSNQSPIKHQLSNWVLQQLLNQLLPILQ